jgi:DNA-directed RNA polymerase subunit RPC12/RpoP
MAAAKKTQVVVSTGHPAAMNKVRCPHCQGYAIGDPHNGDIFKCSRCGKTFKNVKF